MTFKFAHSIVAVVFNVHYRCTRCPFQGTLGEAIGHVVDNQFDLRDGS